MIFEPRWQKSPARRKSCYPRLLVSRNGNLGIVTSSRLRGDEVFASCSYIPCAHGDYAFVSATQANSKDGFPLVMS